MTFNDFNPRVPGGTRQDDREKAAGRVKFQSSRPGWDATYGNVLSISRSGFQSSRPGWDATVPDTNLDSKKIFQSSRPGWDATVMRLT